MANLDEWFASMGRVTKFMFLGMMIVTVAANYNFWLNFRLIMLDFDLVWNKFQIWRLFSNFFFGGRLGFPFLLQIIMFVNYSQVLETELFPVAADYAWVLTVCGSVLLIPAYFLELPFLGRALMFAIIYIFSAERPLQEVNFWLGFKFQASYLPWALVAFTMLMGGKPVSELLGIFAGHTYFYLSHLQGNLIKTPEFMFDLLPDETHAAPVRRNVFQGQGHRLN